MLYFAPVGLNYALSLLRLTGELEMDTSKNKELRNEKGPIAETYNELQSLQILKEIKQETSYPDASYQSLLASILQSVEIALINLADLQSLAIQDLYNNDFGSLVTRLRWICSFHSLLIDLSLVPKQIGFENSVVYSIIHISESKALARFFKQLKKFDSIFINYFANNPEAIDKRSLKNSIANHSFEDPLSTIIHLIRVNNHEAYTWLNNLESIPIPLPNTNYEKFIRGKEISNMVKDRQLKGDTFFQQFRALHQIPEILTFEINNSLEKAIINLREKDWPIAFEFISRANILSPAILTSLSPIVDNLTTSDYHAIRENLGITSGSHSEGIHYHLFRDLYNQIGDIYCQVSAKFYGKPSTETGIVEALNLGASNRLSNKDAFFIYSIGTELLKLRTFVYTWRDRHLHLPRNLVGGNKTRSLKGAHDAIQAVKNMKNNAIKEDQLIPLMISRNISSGNDLHLTGFRDYMDSEKSLDTFIAKITGNITQSRFKHVQERTGIFSKKSKFIPPPERKA